MVNKVTGKRLSGQDGPKLKNLAQWITENDQFEVDPKWAKEMGEKFSGPSDATRKDRGRPSLDDIPSRSTIAPPAVNNTGISAVNIAKLFAALPISRDYSLSHQIGKGTFITVYPRNKLSWP